MRRLLIGLGALFFLLATVVLAVPLFLPKEAIKRQVIVEVEKAVGWRLRLDGSVSLSLLPGFSLIAENVGLSGEAGADGIEFAKAEKIEFGLAWSGLFGGDIQVTGIALTKPDIFLEVGPSGQTSWAPRRDLTPAEEAAEILSGELTTPPAATSSPEPENPAASDKIAYLERIGIDRIDITDGTLVYHDKRSGDRYDISRLTLTLAAPDLTGEVLLDSEFTWREKALTISGSLTNPLALVSGEQVPLELKLADETNSLGVSGEAGINPLRADVAVSASGASLQTFAALAGADLANDPGAFSVFTKVSGHEASLSLSDFSASVGDLGVDGQADVDLRGTVPQLSGRMVLRESGLGDLLAIAGQSYPASGTLKADLTFEASGDTSDSLLATLDLKGSVRLDGGEVSGLDLADAVGGDESANRITDLALELALNGLDQKATLRGGLSWRGDAFSVTGSTTPGPLLFGRSANVSARVKGARLTAGFDGSVSGSNGLEGAVSVETASLRNLLAWVGQPIEAGSGLEAFKASGVFSFAGNTIGFEETRFSLDQTSGEANGRVVLGDRPKIEAKLALNALVLDPYLTAGEHETSAAAVGNGSGNAGGQPGQGISGWSDAKIDFSGLNAADVTFAVTTKEIRWNKIKVDESALNATITNGVLVANLETLRLYNGSGSGNIRLDGKSATPQVSARMSLDGLSAYPVLSDAANFDWLEGTAAIALDVTTSGASQRAMVEALNGTASYNFADGAIRGINIPKLVRGLSVETLLGWQSASTEKTDFSSLTASFDIANGVATTSDVSLIGPLVRMSGKGTTEMPARTLDWRVEPKIVPTLEGQAPTPRKKGAETKMAGLGVPIVIQGSWDNPRIYPDIKGILENPEAAYQQLQSMGGELTKVLKGGKPDEALVEKANDLIKQATGGKSQIDVQKVIEGEVDDQEILKAVEDGFGLPSGLLGNFGIGKKKK